MFYKYQDFTKSDKKLFTPLLHKGINREVKSFLKKSFAENSTF